MWNSILQSSTATAIVDVTNELSPLLIGLVSILWLAAGMLAWSTLHHYLTQKIKPVDDTKSGSTSRREAA
jgi:hypothetical protein